MTVALWSLAWCLSLAAAIGLHRRLRRGHGNAAVIAPAATDRLELLRLAMEHVWDGVLITEAQPLDGTGPRIVYANRAFERLSGYRAGDLIGSSPRLLQGPQTDRATLDRIRAALERVEPVTEEVLNYRPDGTAYWVSLAIVPLTFGTAGVSHFVAIERDVTALRQMLRDLEDGRERYRVLLEERQHLNAELEQRVAARTAELAAINSELEALVYSVSNDLRAPLTRIGGFADLLRRHGRLDDRGAHYLERIGAATERTHALIDALLELSHASSSPLHPAPLRLDRTAGEILAELAEAEPQREVEWCVGAPVRVLGDPQLLRAAITNLLENAWKFTRTRLPARIRVDAGAAPGELIIEDNGIGFDPTRAPELFQPFARLHDARDYPGMGMGLALVRRIVARHGGEIRGTVLAEGGTRFTLRLPPAPGNGHAEEDTGHGNP
jgi:PAS domain S-box-containing protein